MVDEIKALAYAEAPGSSNSELLTGKGALGLEPLAALPGALQGQVFCDRLPVTEGPGKPNAEAVANIGDSAR